MIWYLSYGSNMCRERFLCYITGGKYEGNDRSEEGCRDKTLPVAECTLKIRNKLYFAERSTKWQNKGVAFITHDKGKEATTHAKKYLITREQFEDIVKQENRISINDTIEIDYDELEETGKYLLFSDRYYGMILKIEEGVYTFTRPVDAKEYVKPSKEYLATLIKAIKENKGGDK